MAPRPLASFLVASFILVAFPLTAAPQHTPMPVGVAQVDITPDDPIRLSGFGGRRAESEGVTQRIWAKALAFGDEELGPAVLITTDNLGIPDAITREIAARLGRKAGLRAERLSITASHTHTAPMLTDVVPTLFGTDIPPEHQARIDQYTRVFIDKLEQVALAAIRDIRPSHISWGIGTVGFAANRRTAGGPVDHDLPVMVVRDADGKPRAIFFSYACHCVTLSHNKVSGDWAGYAMEQVQASFPDTIALAAVGCGADANPDSGVTGDKVEVADAQGRQIATEVVRLLASPLTPLTTTPSCKLDRVQLAFASPRTRAEWETRAQLNDAVGYHARVNLARLDRGESLPTGIDYPVQTWRFGDQLAMVFLPGEVVVDYSLRLKHELDRTRLWINAYANDAPCYIPSERVLKEGGYEGGDAMIYYDQPQKFAPGLEEKIIATVRAQVPDAFTAPEGTEGTAPRSPDQARHTLRTKPGLVVELAASEPLIQSPVAIDWDAAGRLWVCEMWDYPTGLDQNWLPGGRVKRLEDINGDGTYDRAILFLDGLPFPTGLMAWGRGVLVCAAPDILYAEDTDGDGKADRVEKLFTGFAADNYQARVNGLSLGLDNWIYGANGLLGGVIRGPQGDLDIRGRDFRFRFPQGVMQAVDGLTQQGRVRDDWGRWFGCNNGSALDYYPHEARYFQRNPNAPAPPASISPSGDFDIGRVYPISRVLERFNDPEAANRITSGCGLGLYRDTLLGAEYENNAFTCEPVHNLVHRLVLEEDQLQLRRHRPSDETQSEFLASTDNWFRPVQVRPGPDGALYVVDMYRFLIEHPRWIPAARLARIDVRAGASMGRIWKLRPADQPLRTVRDLTALNTISLAAALESPNGTERDRVQVELLNRSDPAAHSILQVLATSSSLPQVRLQALSTLAGLGDRETPAWIAALRDKDDRVRSGAIRLGEVFLASPAQSPTASIDASYFRSALLALTNTSSLRVARQLAFSLGEFGDARAGRALAFLARRWLDQEEVRAAVLSSASPHVAELLTMILDLDPSTPGADAWLEPLVATAAASDDEAVFNRALLALLQDTSSPFPNRFPALAQLLAALDRRQTTPQDYFSERPELRASATQLKAMLALASRLASDPNQPLGTRVAALQLVGRADAASNDLEILCRVLIEGGPDTLRDAATAGLRRQRNSGVADRLLATWPQTPPAARQQVLSLLLSRDAWTLRLLDAVAGQTVQAHEIAMADRQRLARSDNADIQERAARLLPVQTSSPRAEVLTAYQKTLSLAGDAERGREVFANNCMTCHALGDLGHAVGPDLAGLRGREPDYWLKNILDPNAVVEPRFIAYNLELDDDRSLSGIIQGETATSLTLVAANGVTEVVARSAIKDLQASSLSLMPEGLEQAIPPQAMADLLAFVIPRSPPKRFAGNQPDLVMAGANGVLILPAAQAEIFGGDIAFETQFGNIGMWHGLEDYVAWSIEVPAAGAYDIHLDYACANGSAGNGFRLAVTGQSLTGRVNGTGPDWSRYVSAQVGTLQLEAGRHRLTFRPEDSLRGALLDLRTVALCPPGQSPGWPKPASLTPPDGLLRDPVSIARFLLDPAQPDNAREAVIAANPQYAADFIAEMTRDLPPDAATEYARIPWIWRVAISCGKRNDPAQMRRVLEVSLPARDEPLRHWQAVVLGGGLINGLSQRGVWPAKAMLDLCDDDEALLKRWRHALDLAAAMTDDTDVPSGTRYDALRMLGMEPWEKRGDQLARYLARGTHGELQMGAVSALGDVQAPQATASLVKALNWLEGGNRDLALDALLRDDARALALLDQAAALDWKSESLGEGRATKLLEHPNPDVRTRARAVLAP